MYMPATKIPYAPTKLNICRGASVKAQGFTLIELVIGIIVFSIALALFSSLLVPQARRSVEPIFQVRATELAQSLINEITAKAFDEQSSKVGGNLRCNEVGQPACTAIAELGSDGEDRASYDDVDDYHNYIAANAEIRNSLGDTLSSDGANLYEGFSAEVQVVYDSNMDGIDDNVVGNRKLITVTVTPPNGEDIRFSTYRSNY